MTCLLSNDDGVASPGLEILARHLREIVALEVVAPDRDHSGASNSLTLDRPLRPIEHANGFVSIDGTPTDCVHIGLTALHPDKIERVISGINTHANLGDDVLYSGTVAAAMEGRFLELPAIAVSLVNQGAEHFETAARVIVKLLQSHQPLKVGPRTILNVNVPDVPYEALKGYRVTRLGHRARGGVPQKITDPRGRDRYWIAAAGEGDDAGSGTDFDAVARGFVSITPIQVDMTRYDAFADINSWLEGLE